MRRRSLTSAEAWESMLRQSDAIHREEAQQRPEQLYDPTRQYMRDGIDEFGRPKKSIVDFDRDTALSDKYKMGFDPSRVDYDFANKYAEYLEKNQQMPQGLTYDAVKAIYNGSNTAISNMYKSLLGQRGDGSGEEAVAKALRAQEALGARDIRTLEEFEDYDWGDDEEQERELIQGVLDMYSSFDDGDAEFWKARDAFTKRDLMTQKLLYPNLKPRQEDEAEEKPWEIVDSMVGMEDASKRLRSVIGDGPLLEEQDGLYRFKDPSKMKAIRRELETIRNENEYTRAKDFWGSFLPDGAARAVASTGYVFDQAAIENDASEEKNFLTDAFTGAGKTLAGWVDFIPSMKDAVTGWLGGGDDNKERAATNSRMSEIERALEVFELAKDGVAKGEGTREDISKYTGLPAQSWDVYTAPFALRFLEGASSLGEFVGIPSYYEGNTDPERLKFMRSQLERERSIELFDKITNDISAPFIRENDEETITDQVAQFGEILPGLFVPGPKGSVIAKAPANALNSVGRFLTSTKAGAAAAKGAEKAVKLADNMTRKKALDAISRRTAAWQRAGTWQAKALNLPDKLADTPYIGAMLNVVNKAAKATGRTLTSQEARDEAMDMGLKFAVANYLTDNGNANSAQIAEAARSGALFGYAGNVIGQALTGIGSKVLQHFGNKAPNAALEKLVGLGKYADDWAAESEAMFGVSAFKESAKQAVKTTSDNVSKALLQTAGRPLAEVAETRVVDAMEEGRISALWSNKEGKFDLMLRNEDYADMISGMMMMMAPMGKGTGPVHMYKAGKLAVTDWRSLNKELKKVQQEVAEFTQDVDREIQVLKTSDIEKIVSPDDIVGKARRYQEMVGGTFGEAGLTYGRNVLKDRFDKFEGVDTDEKFNKGFFAEDINDGLSKANKFELGALERSMRKIAQEEGIDVDGRFTDEVMADVFTKLDVDAIRQRLTDGNSKGMRLFENIVKKYGAAAEKYGQLTPYATSAAMKTAIRNGKGMPAPATPATQQGAQLPLNVVGQPVSPQPTAAQPVAPTPTPTPTPAQQVGATIKEKAKKLPKPEDVLKKNKTKGTPEQTTVDIVEDPTSIEEINNDIAYLQDIDPVEAMVVESDIIDPQVAAEVNLIAENAIKMLKGIGQKTSSEEQVISQVAAAADQAQQMKEQQDVIALASQGVPVEEAQKILQQGGEVPKEREPSTIDQEAIDRELGGASAKGDPSALQAADNIKAEQLEQELDDFDLYFSDTPVEPIDSPDMPRGMNFRATYDPKFKAEDLQTIMSRPHLSQQLIFNIALGRAVYNRLARKFGYEPKFSMFYDPRVKFSGVNTADGIRVMAGLKAGTIAETVAHEFYHSLLDGYSQGSDAMRNIFVNSMWESDLRDRLSELYEYGMPKSASEMIMRAEDGDVGAREEVLVQAMAHYGASDAMGIGIDFFKRVFSEVNKAAQQKIAPLGIAEEAMTALKDAYAIANARQAQKAIEEAPATPITQGEFMFSPMYDEDAIDAGQVPIEKQWLEKLLHLTESVKKRKEDPIDELSQVLDAIPGHFKEKRQDMLRSLVDGRMKDPKALRAFVQEKIDLAFPSDGNPKTEVNKKTAINRLVASLGAFGEMYERPEYVDVDFSGGVNIMTQPSTTYKTPPSLGGKKLSEFKKKRAGFAQYAKRVKDMFYTGGPESHVGEIIQGFANSRILDVGSFLDEKGEFSPSIPTAVYKDLSYAGAMARRGFFYAHSADSSPAIHDMRAIFDKMSDVEGTQTPSMIKKADGTYEWTESGLNRLSKARRRVVGRYLDKFIDTGMWIVQSDKKGVTRVGRDKANENSFPLWDFVTWDKNGVFSIIPRASDAIKTDPNVLKEVERLNKEFTPALLEKQPTIFSEIGLDPIKKGDEGWLIFSDIGLQTMLTHLDPSMKWANPIIDPDNETRPKSPIKYISEIYRREATRSLERFKELQPDMKEYLFDEAGNVRERVATERGTMPSGLRLDKTGNLAVKTFYIDSRTQGVINKLFGDTADGAVISINPVAHKAVAAVHGQNPKGPHKTAGNWPVGNSTMLWKQATHDYTDYGYSNSMLDQLIKVLRDNGYGYIAIDSAIKGGTEGGLKWNEADNARGTNDKGIFNKVEDILQAIQRGDNTFDTPITGEDGLKFVKPSSVLNDEASGLSVIHTPAMSPISPLLANMQGGASKGFQRVKELARNVGRRHAKEVEDYLILNSMFSSGVGADFSDVHKAAKRYLPKLLKTLERGEDADKWMIPYVKTAMEAVTLAPTPEAAVSVMRILQTQTDMFHPKSAASRGIGRSIEKGLRTRSRGAQLYITPSLSTQTDIASTKVKMFTKDKAGNPAVNWEYISSDAVADILQAKGVDIAQYATGEQGRLTDKDIEKVKDLVTARDVFDWYKDFLAKNLTKEGYPDRQAVLVSPDAAEAMGWKIGQKVFGHITPSDDHHSLIPHRIAGFLKESQKQSVAYSPHTSMKVQGKDHDIDTYSLTTLDAAADRNPDWESSDGVHIFYDLWNSLDKADYYYGQNKLENKEIVNDFGDKIFERYSKNTRPLYNADPTGNPLATGVTKRYVQTFAEKGIGLYSTLGTKAGLLLQKGYSLLSQGQLEDQKEFLAQFGETAFENFFRRFASYKEAAVDGFNMPKYEMTNPGAASRWAKTFTPIFSLEDIPTKVSGNVSQSGINRKDFATSFSMYEGTTMGEALRPFMRAMHGYFIDDPKKSSTTMQTIHDDYKSKPVPPVPLDPAIQNAWSTLSRSSNSYTLAMTKRDDAKDLREPQWLNRADRIKPKYLEEAWDQAYDTIKAFLNLKADDEVMPLIDTFGPEGRMYTKDNPLPFHMTPLATEFNATNPASFFNDIDQRSRQEGESFFSALLRSPANVEEYRSSIFVEPVYFDKAGMMVNAYGEPPARVKFGMFRDDLGRTFVVADKNNIEFSFGGQTSPMDPNKEIVSLEQFMEVIGPRPGNKGNNFTEYVASRVNPNQWQGYAVTAQKNNLEPIRMLHSGQGYSWDVSLSVTPDMYEGGKLRATNDQGARIKVGMGSHIHGLPTSIAKALLYGKGSRDAAFNSPVTMENKARLIGSGILSKMPEEQKPHLLGSLLIGQLNFDEINAKSNGVLIKKGDGKGAFTEDGLRNAIFKELSANADMPMPRIALSKDVDLDPIKAMATEESRLGPLFNPMLVQAMLSPTQQAGEEGGDYLQNSYPKAPFSMSKDPKGTPFRHLPLPRFSLQQGEDDGSPSYTERTYWEKDPAVKRFAMSAMRMKAIDLHYKHQEAEAMFGAGQRDYPLKQAIAGLLGYATPREFLRMAGKFSGGKDPYLAILDGTFDNDSFRKMLEKEFVKEGDTLFSAMLEASDQYFKDLESEMSQDASSTLGYRKLKPTVRGIQAYESYLLAKDLGRRMKAQERYAWMQEPQADTFFGRVRYGWLTSVADRTNLIKSTPKAAAHLLGTQRKAMANNTPVATFVGADGVKTVLTAGDINPRNPFGMQFGGSSNVSVAAMAIERMDFYDRMTRDLKEKLIEVATDAASYVNTKSVSDLVQLLSNHDDVMPIAYTHDKSSWITPSVTYKGITANTRTRNADWALLVETMAEDISSNPNYASITEGLSKEEINAAAGAYLANALFYETLRSNVDNVLKPNYDMEAVNTNYYSVSQLLGMPADIQKRLLSTLPGYDPSKLSHQQAGIMHASQDAKLLDTVNLLSKIDGQLSGLLDRKVNKELLEPKEYMKKLREGGFFKGKPPEVEQEVRSLVYLHNKYLRIAESLAFSTMVQGESPTTKIGVTSLSYETEGKFNVDEQVTTGYDVNAGLVTGTRSLVAPNERKLTGRISADTYKRFIDEITTSARKEFTDMVEFSWRMQQNNEFKGVNENVFIEQEVASLAARLRDEEAMSAFYVDDFETLDVADEVTVMVDGADLISQLFGFRQDNGMVRLLKVGGNTYVDMVSGLGVELAKDEDGHKLIYSKYADEEDGSVTTTKVTEMRVLGDRIMRRDSNVAGSRRDRKVQKDLIEGYIRSNMPTGANKSFGRTAYFANQAYSQTAPLSSVNGMLKLANKMTIANGYLGYEKIITGAMVGGLGALTGDVPLMISSLAVFLDFGLKQSGKMAKNFGSIARAWIPLVGFKGAFEAARFDSKTQIDNNIDQTVTRFVEAEIGSEDKVSMIEKNKLRKRAQIMDAMFREAGQIGKTMVPFKGQDYEDRHWAAELNSETIDNIQKEIKAIDPAARLGQFFVSPTGRLLDEDGRTQAEVTAIADSIRRNFIIDPLNMRKLMSWSEEKSQGFAKTIGISIMKELGILNTRNRGMMNAALRNNIEYSSGLYGQSDRMRYEFSNVGKFFTLFNKFARPSTEMTLGRMWDNMGGDLFLRQMHAAAVEAGVPGVELKHTKYGDLVSAPFLDVTGASVLTMYPWLRDTNKRFTWSVATGAVSWLAQQGWKLAIIGALGRAGGFIDEDDENNGAMSKMLAGIDEALDASGLGGTGLASVAENTFRSLFYMYNEVGNYLTGKYVEERMMGQKAGKRKAINAKGVEQIYTKETTGAPNDFTFSLGVGQGTSAMLSSVMETGLWMYYNATRGDEGRLKKAVGKYNDNVASHLTDKVLTGTPVVSPAYTGAIRPMLKAQKAKGDAGRKVPENEEVFLDKVK